MDTLSKVKEIVANQLRKPVEEITEEKEVVKDLGADSLDIVEMLMSLEEEFGITVSEDDAMKIKTVGDIVKAIDGNK